jgi:hypothetical protein
MTVLHLAAEMLLKIDCMFVYSASENLAEVLFNFMAGAM